MKERTRKLVDRHITDWETIVRRIRAVGRPVELHFEGTTLVGRADVIIDESGGQERLEIVDCKTAADAHEQRDFQLQVYTDAERREGVTVDRVFVHDLCDAERIAVPVGKPDVAGAEALVASLVALLSAREVDPAPENERCARCDVRHLCPASA
jgi:CRISPR/Cas system-associated exonuclease Cas4 (RecB family)